MTLWQRVYEERKGIILPLGLVLVANLAVFLLAVVPLQTTVTAAQNDALNAKMELAEARRFDRQAKDARASKDRADAEIKKFYSETLPHDLQTATKVTGRWLEQAANDAGVEFQGSHFESEEIKDSKLSRAHTKFTLQGRYQNIRKFLYAVETAVEFIIVERVELQEYAAGQPGANGLLVVSLTVSTDFPTPTGPATR